MPDHTDKAYMRWDKSQADADWLQLRLPNGTLVSWIDPNGFLGGNLAAGGTTPGGTAGQLQGNNTGVFGGLPGSTLDFTNGTIALAPTGTGVPLSVTGDAHASDIQDWTANAASGGTPGTPNVKIDTFGNTTIAPINPGDVAFTVVGNNILSGRFHTTPDVADFYSTGQTFGNWGMSIQQATPPSQALTIVLRDSFGNFTNIGPTVFSSTQGNTNFFISPGLVQFAGDSFLIVPNGSITYPQPFALSVAGDSSSNDIQDWFTFGNRSTPAVVVDTKGNLILHQHLNQGGDNFASPATTDVAGTITVTSSTSAAYTFLTPFTSAPVVVLTPQTNPTGVGVYWVVTTNTGFTVNVASVGTITFNYVVVGNPN